MQFLLLNRFLIIEVILQKNVHIVEPIKKLMPLSIHLDIRDCKGKTVKNVVFKTIFFTVLFVVIFVSIDILVMGSAMQVLDMLISSHPC